MRSLIETRAQAMMCLPERKPDENDESLTWEEPGNSMSVYESIHSEGKTMNLNEFLRGVSLFSMLPDEDLKKISERAQEIKYVRDAFICKEAEKADSMFIIKSGIVQIFCDDGKVVLK